MKYIKLFEGFGINKGVEYWAQEYFYEIQKSNSDKFHFKYSNDKGEFEFDLTISQRSKYNKGHFSYQTGINDMVINIADRNDYSTLLHELKHLDRFTRVAKTGSLRKLKQWSGLLEDNKLNTIFYLLDPDEFEARLHGYYSDLDKYLSKNVPSDADNKLVFKYVKQFLRETDDVSWGLYQSRSEIKVQNFADEDYLKRLFIALIEGDAVKKYSLKYLKNIIKSIVGMNKFDNEYYEKTIRYINKILNKNRLKFKKKFDRMVYGLVDKYVK